MKILTSVQGGKWLRDRNLSTDFSELKRIYKHSLAYLLDADSGSKTALARGLRSFIANDGTKEDGALWVKEFGVWPSSENLDLFYEYRKTMKEKRSLLKAPFHVFGRKEMKELECLLDLSLFFFWDVILVSPGLKFIVFASHDEYIEVLCQEKKTLEEFEDFFKKMQYKKMVTRSDLFASWIKK